MLNNNNKKKSIFFLFMFDYFNVFERTGAKLKDISFLHKYIQFKAQRQSLEKKISFY